MGQLTFLLLCVLPAAMLFSESCARTTDMTLQEGAGGKDVVDAVLGKLRENCIFSDDRLFMRRLAYVETRDGTLYETYSTGYNGGIWKVDENMFKATQTCPSHISKECSLLRASSQFQYLEWTKVTWSDLRKPLYSGVASALYMLLQLRNTSQQMPGEVEGQASIWSTLYRPGSSSLRFSEAAESVTSINCRGKMDVVFVMDASGSVSLSNFNLTLQFAAAVTQALPVSRDEARVGMVVFSTTASVAIYLKDYTTSADLVSAILKTKYSGGLTYTDLALNLVRTQLFSSANGGRSGVRRVTILLTDGLSSNTQSTAASARLLRDEGSIIYAVGIGGYNLPELQSIASQPVCSHVFTLDKFSYITAILTEIQKSTCEATIVIPPDQDVEDTIPEEGSDNTVETDEPNNDEHVEVDVDCGEVDAYVSYKNSNPGPALYDEFKKAVHRQPARLGMGSRLSGSGRMYLRLIARRLSAQEAAEKNCSGYNYTVGSKPNPPPTTRPPTTTQRPTTTRPPTTTKPPTDSGLPGCYPSPCTPENIAAQRFYFPYTLDTSKFIQCDAFGKTFLMSCPAGLVWNQVNYACSWPRRR